MNEYPMTVTKSAKLRLRTGEKQIDLNDPETFELFNVSVEVKIPSEKAAVDYAVASAVVKAQNGKRKMTPEEFTAMYPDGVIGVTLGEARKSEPTEFDFFCSLVKTRGLAAAKRAVVEILGVDVETVEKWEKLVK